MNSTDNHRKSGLLVSPSRSMDFEEMLPVLIIAAMPMKGDVIDQVGHDRKAY